MKNRMIFGPLLWVCAGIAVAQTAPPKTYDGAVVVDGQSRTATPAAQGAAPPLVVANSAKTTATGWNANDSGAVTIKGVNSGTGQSVTLNPGTGAKLGASSAGQPATIVRTGATTRTVTYSEACPAGYTGTISYDQQEVQTVSDKTWTATGPKTNVVNACVAGVQTRWVAQSKTCPVYYTGDITWEAEESSTGGGAWTATGNTRNYNDGCVATVDTRWVAMSQACAAYYTGSISWEAEEQKVGGGGWSSTGRTRNRIDGCTATVETRWIAASAACPAGQEGSNTWEAEETRSGGGAWTATGRTRNNSNTCATPEPQGECAIAYAAYLAQGKVYNRTYYGDVAGDVTYPGTPEPGTILFTGPYSDMVMQTYCAATILGSSKSWKVDGLFTGTNWWTGQPVWDDPNAKVMWSYK